MHSQGMNTCRYRSCISIQIALWVFQFRGSAATGRMFFAQRDLEACFPPGLAFYLNVATEFLDNAKRMR